MPGIFVTCRLCTKKYSSTALMENMFHGEAVTAETIRVVTQINVVEGDGLPEHVCLFCIFSLNSAKNFIQSCVESNTKLKLQSRMKGKKCFKIGSIKKTSTPVVTPASGFRKRLKVELFTPQATEGIVRRLELAIDAQDNAGKDNLETEHKEEDDFLDQTDFADFCKPVLETGNNVEEQGTKPGELKPTQAPDSIISPELETGNNVEEQGTEPGELTPTQAPGSIVSPELKTGNNVEEQGTEPGELTPTQVPGSIVSNPADLQGAEGGSSKEDKCKKQESSSEPIVPLSPGLYLKNEPKLDESALVLSWYDSDLNLVINKSDFLSAVPVHVDIFGYMWAGARATFGFAGGKLAFQTKVEEDLDVSHLERQSCPNALRVGWSMPGTSMQLGEEPGSYGFCSTGKTYVDRNFKQYGVPFKVGDIVTSYLEWTTKDVVLSFAVNGKNHGEAFRVPRTKLNGQPLFPHVLSKNQLFSVDFGSLEEPWFPLDKGFVFVGAVPEESRVAGPRRPEKKEDCEMVMMCGLPGAGKTTWVNNYVAVVPEKRFNILGTNALIAKMRVNGLTFKSNYKGSWEQFIEKCTRCVLKLLDVARGRHRNYILDQTNVYQSAQKRKMQGFERFKCRAIVIVPNDKEFKSRRAKQEERKGKYILDSAVLEMKANFVLPKEGDVFSKVTFVELGRKKAQVLLDHYKKEAQAAGCDQNKRPRSNSCSSLDGSFHFQGREYRTKRGKDWPGFRGSDRQPRGSSRGSQNGRSNHRSVNPYSRALQASTSQNTTAHKSQNQGSGGLWSNDNVWMQNYNQQQHGSGSHQVWNNLYVQQRQLPQQRWGDHYGQHTWNKYGQQMIIGQQGDYYQQSSYYQQTRYGNFTN